MAQESMPLGIVVERRDSDHPWESETWNCVAVVPGAPEIDSWRLLDEGPGWTRYHCGTISLEIFGKDTEGYKYNLGHDQPIVYVLLRYDEDAENGIVPFLATVCPYEAQAYLDGDEDLVEPVPMPDGVAAWLGTFVETHHVDEPHYKRKREPHKDSPRNGPRIGPVQGNA